MFLHLAHFSKTTKRSERKEGTNAAARRRSRRADRYVVGEDGPRRNGPFSSSLLPRGGRAARSPLVLSHLFDLITCNYVKLQRKGR